MVICLSEVDYLGDHGLADQYIDGLEVQMEDIVLNEMLDAVNNVDD